MAGVRRGAAAPCATASRAIWPCPGLQRERVLAAVVRLVDETLIRVGNEEYRRTNGSYGATTMRSRHAQRGRPPHHGRVQGQVRQAAPRRGLRPAARPHACRSSRTCPAASSSSTSTTTASAARALGRRQPLSREISGAGITVKDFRTWGASALCIRALNDLDPPASPTAAKRSIAGAIRDVATALGNTPAVCRASYVHPAHPRGLRRRRAAARRRRAACKGLDRWESALLRFLRARS